MIVSAAMLESSVSVRVGVSDKTGEMSGIVTGEEVRLCSVDKGSDAITGLAVKGVLICEAGWMISKDPESRDEVLSESVGGKNVTAVLVLDINFPKGSRACLLLVVKP